MIYNFGRSIKSSLKNLTKRFAKMGGGDYNQDAFKIKVKIYQDKITW